MKIFFCVFRGYRDISAVIKARRGSHNPPAVKSAQTCAAKSSVSSRQTYLPVENGRMCRLAGNVLQAFWIGTFIENGAKIQTSRLHRRVPRGFR